jgi:hypothetical protein
MVDAAAVPPSLSELLALKMTQPKEREQMRLVKIEGYSIHIEVY